MTHLKKHVVNQSQVIRKAPIPYHHQNYAIPKLCVSLKQWRILHAVIECGGFSEAAKYLHLSQSAISYTLAKMQDQLGVQVLKLEGRKAILTTEGRALLERSRHVLKEALELENFAKNMEHEKKSPIRLAVDQNFPSSILMCALRNFTTLGGSTPCVHLREVSSLETEELLRKHAVDLIISGRVPLGFLGEPLIEVEYIPVAHHDYVLASPQRDLTTADLARYTQIGIGYLDEHDKSEQGDISCMYQWTMNSVDSVVQAVCEGLGYAWLPVHRVQKWLDEGTLVRLPVVDQREYKAVLYLIHARTWSTSPAANRFAEVLRSFTNMHVEPKPQSSELNHI